MVHVGRLVQEGGHLGDLVDDVLVYLLAGHHQQEPLQVVGGDLVKHHLDIQLVVQAEGVVPHRPAGGVSKHFHIAMRAENKDSRSESLVVGLLRDCEIFANLRLIL